MTYEQLTSHVRNLKGIIVVRDLTKRQSQYVNKIKGTASAPVAVEIYNAAVGGFSDVEVDYPKFISSAAKSARELQNTNVFTLINRHDLESLGFLPQGEGENYVPDYLQNDDTTQSLQTPGDYIPTVGENRG